jgi:mono/diheme cytochrome c family protein
VGGFAGGNPKSGGTYLEAIVEAEDPPPAISGGTLTTIGQGHRAAVADPDRDQLVVADLDTMTIVSTATFGLGDEPGRVIEDGAGRLHVVLRSGRAVAVVDPNQGNVLARLPICMQPRGLAYEPAADAIHVACAGGELVTYSASNGGLLRRIRLENDLRDVVVDGDRLMVSRFRAAELLVVESNGSVSATLRPPPGIGGAPPDGGPGLPALSAVAWRTVPAPEGGALMVYQTLKAQFVQVRPGGYGSGGCLGSGGIITTSISLLRLDGSGFTLENIPAVLPVDLAATTSHRLAVPSGAWSPANVNALLQPFVEFGPTPVPTRPPQRSTPLGACTSPLPRPLDGGNMAVPKGRVVAVAYDAFDVPILQTREPATLVVGTRTLDLPGRSRKHTGHELFHLATVGGIACASCHPEGHEDGQVWNFVDFGPRRTQSLRGGISGTEPFHWTGDMANFSTLAHDVFSSRMSGPLTSEQHLESLFRWIDKIPSLPPPVAEDPEAVERGRLLFNDADVGCASCHSGEKLSNNATVDVHTGGSFQVPSLRGVVWRAPYLHQGAAKTLADRFNDVGGGEAHGHTATLTTEQRVDLVKYLETL